MIIITFSFWMSIIQHDFTNCFDFKTGADGIFQILFCPIIKIMPACHDENTVKSDKIGYWAAQEQYSMRHLASLVQEAERVGFQSTMTSDHFHPWSHTNAFSNFTWVWIAYAAQQTNKMRFITGVTSPVFRYHPAIIAQAFASLDCLYPHRIGLGLGTGEAMNESPLGLVWPTANERLSRVIEAVKIIRKLWHLECHNDHEKKVKSGFQNFKGDYYTLKKARLYTPPVTKIPIYLAAAGRRSARAAAKYFDGLITFLNASESEILLKSFRETAILNNKDPDRMEIIAEYKVSISNDLEKAINSASFWRATLLADVFKTPISDPRVLEKLAAEKISDQRLAESIHITNSEDELIKYIEEYFKSGFTRVYLHSTSPDEYFALKKFNKVIKYFDT